MEKKCLELFTTESVGILYILNQQNTVTVLLRLLGHLVSTKRYVRIFEVNNLISDTQGVKFTDTVFIADDTFS